MVELNKLPFDAINNTMSCFSFFDLTWGIYRTGGVSPPLKNSVFSTQLQENISKVGDYSSIDKSSLEFRIICTTSSERVLQKC